MSDNQTTINNLHAETMEQPTMLSIFDAIKSKTGYLVGLLLWPIFKEKPYNPNKDAVDCPAFQTALRSYEEADGIKAMDKGDKEIFRIAFAAGWRARARV